MNWQSFKALYQLFEIGKTPMRDTLLKDRVFKYHARQTKELLFTKKEILVKDHVSWDRTFRNRYLAKYNECLELLTSINEHTPQCRFEMDDILCLAELKRQMNNGELDEIRQQIIDSNETRRGVSLMFFRNEKHLDRSEALERAVKNILRIEEFADDRDFQYLYVLQCNEPKVIVLCENLYFLKMPGKARLSQIELWYAGGRNVEKLIYTQSRDLPIFYLCDWDFDGLDIFELVKLKIPQIELLTPNGPRKDIIKTEHKSSWRFQDSPSRLSGLDSRLYNDEQKELIMQLIVENAWIVEESNNLITMLSA